MKQILSHVSDIPIAFMHLMVGICLFVGIALSVALVMYLGYLMFY